jgi:hypothetical protein
LLFGGGLGDEAIFFRFAHVIHGNQVTYI